jgi:predicted ATP-grasp superfamily ATP-dependent carboligase
MKYYIINLPFEDWQIIFRNNNKFTYVKSIDLINENENYKIIPMYYNNFIECEKEKLLFYTDEKIIMIMENKVLFAQFMMENFENYIPKNIYYNFNNKIMYKANNLTTLMIKKNIFGSGGTNIEIINTNDFQKYESKMNILISEYVTHNLLFAGHFLIINGILIEKIYFYVNTENGKLYKGRLCNYKVIKNITLDDSIFMNIFNKLKYSGFACIDFTIVNNKIVIFEINPRIGGSLVFNIFYFNLFMSKLIKHQSLSK